MLNDDEESIDEVPEEISRTVFQTVRIGSRVLLQDESGTPVLCTMAVAEKNGHLNGGSRVAPALRRALLGRGVGEEVHVWTSRRGWRVTILEVD
jgi:transcription elongation GreA/GreB family factor